VPPKRGEAEAVRESGAVGEDVWVPCPPPTTPPASECVGAEDAVDVGVVPAVAEAVGEPEGVEEAERAGEGEREVVTEEEGVPVAVPLPAESVVEGEAVKVAGGLGVTPKVVEGLGLALPRLEALGLALEVRLPPSVAVGAPEGVWAGLALVALEGVVVCVAEDVRHPEVLGEAVGHTVTVGESVRCSCGEEEAGTESVRLREGDLEGEAEWESEALGEGVSNPAAREAEPLLDTEGHRDTLRVRLGEAEFDTDHVGEARGLGVVLGVPERDCEGEALPLRVGEGEAVEDREIEGVGEGVGLMLNLELAEAEAAWDLDTVPPPEAEGDPLLAGDALDDGEAEAERPAEGEPLSVAVREAENVAERVMLPVGERLEVLQCVGEALGVVDCEAEPLEEGEGAPDALKDFVTEGDALKLGERDGQRVTVGLLLTLGDLLREGVWLSVTDGLRAALTERDTVELPLRLGEALTDQVAVKFALALGEALTERVRLGCPLALEDPVGLLAALGEAGLEKERDEVEESDPERLTVGVELYIALTEAEALSLSCPPTRKHCSTATSTQKSIVH
jgi:hypothetical protein